MDRDGYVVIDDALARKELERLEAAVDEVYAAERGEAGGPLHLLAFCGRDGAFLELLDHPATLPLVVDALGPNVFMYHCHLDVHPPEPPGGPLPWMWHQDGGVVNRDLEGAPRPRMSLKVAYFLTDVSEPGRGNFVLLPGSHRSDSIERPPDDDNDVPGARPVLARPGDAVVFDRRVWHMRSRNGSSLTRKALFYAYTYRWVRPRDDLRVRADLLHLVTPVRAQLLGAGERAIDFWMPDEVALPVRDAMPERSGLAGPAGGALPAG
ncbi:MAG TPA: phytanoyl-CoA dioxygenase family protein [Gemmatimonadota bacterium]|nr:phytanoyl-CoA dioxygenase family protein [Gemmatimonadota bacterium]